MIDKRNLFLLFQMIRIKNIRKVTLSVNHASLKPHAGLQKRFDQIGFSIRKKNLQFGIIEFFMEIFGNLFPGSVYPYSNNIKGFAWAFCGKRPAQRTLTQIQSLEALNVNHRAVRHKKPIRNFFQIPELASVFAELE